MNVSEFVYGIGDKSRKSTITTAIIVVSGRVIDARGRYYTINAIALARPRLDRGVPSPSDAKLE